MNAAARGLTYGVLGWGIEVCYTALKAAAKGDGDGRLAGESYVWMFPIYAAGGLAGEVVASTASSRSWWQRGLAYAATFWAVEASTGEALRRTIGDVPWGEDYRRYRDQLGGGLVRASYLPNWAVAGFALERLAPVLRRLVLQKSVA